MKVDVIILAGAPAGEELSPGKPDISRAMVDIGGKTMIQWILDALQSAKSVGRIVAVGNVEAVGLEEVLPPGSGFLDNLLAAIDACAESDRVLVMTSDIPLITPESLDDFIERAASSCAEMCYPIVTKESCLARYPGMKRTYLKTAEGMFTGGNIMLLNPSFVRRNSGLISGAYAARKNPLALARMVGLGFLMRLAMAQIVLPKLLPVPVLERKLSKVLGGKVAAIRTAYPEIGADVDKLSDLEAVRACLNA